MASLTTFQEEKILRVFRMLYDCNNDGVIEKQDFNILLQKICSILEWEKGGVKYGNAEETLNIIWKGLAEYADTNNDAKVTHEEWLQMWGDCLKNLEEGHFPTWQKKYMDLMFDVYDKSGDDAIDLMEYTTFLSQFGISEDDCEKAFELINGGEKISRDQFEGLWRDYLTSNDPNAPGNFLFGPELN